MPSAAVSENHHSSAGEIYGGSFPIKFKSRSSNKQSALHQSLASALYILQPLISPLFSSCRLPPLLFRIGVNCV